MYYRVLFTESKEHEPRISLVDDPAIEVKSVMLRKDVEPIQLSKLQTFNNDKQIVSGLALVSDKWIPRYDKKAEREYYIMFTPDQIALYKDAFINNGGKINFEHTNRMIEVEVLQCCLIGEEELKYPCEGEPKQGDLFLAIHVKNTDDWQEIKQGKHNGFSIEGVFNHKLIEFKNDARMVANETIEADILKYLSECGMKQPDNWRLATEEEYLSDQNQTLTNDPTDRDSVNDFMKADGSGMWRVRYKYSGPSDEKNRNFCFQILDFDRIYTEEEIKNGLFNPEFGNYSIWDYKGSYGCRHVWERLIFFEDFEDNEVRRVGNVPQVTAQLDDQDARTLNANLVKQIKMEAEEKAALKEQLRAEILQELAAEKEQEEKVEAEQKEEEEVKAESEEKEESTEKEVEERESEDTEKDEFAFTENMYNGILEQISELKALMSKDEEEEGEKTEMKAEQHLSREAYLLKSFPR